MPNTLTKGVDVIALPDDLLWTDEFGFSTVVAESSFGMDGALIVDEAVRLAGRPMTLEAGEQHGWMTRSTLLALEAWRLFPGQAFTLNFRGTNYAVRMDHERGAINARPLIDYANPAAGDFYIVTLRFVRT